jgi:hypothetical protein
MVRAALLVAAGFALAECVGTCLLWWYFRTEHRQEARMFELIDRGRAS